MEGTTQLSDSEENVFRVHQSFDLLIQKTYSHGRKTDANLKQVSIIINKKHPVFFFQSHAKIKTDTWKQASVAKWTILNYY